jgi:hypothetical protein
LLKNLSLFKNKKRFIILNIIYITTLKNNIIKSIPFKHPNTKDLILKELVLLSKKRCLNFKSIITFLNIYKANINFANFGLLLRPINRKHT